MENGRPTQPPSCGPPGLPARKRHRNRARRRREPGTHCCDSSATSQLPSAGGDEQPEDTLGERTDPMCGAVIEDPEEENIRIIHWMPTYIRWISVTPIQSERDRRPEKRNRRHTMLSACIPIRISMTAPAVTTLSALGIIPAGQWRRTPPCTKEKTRCQVDATR